MRTLQEGLCVVYRDPGPAVTAARHLLLSTRVGTDGAAALVMAALDVSDRAAYRSIELTEVGMVADHWLWMGSTSRWVCGS